MGIFNRPVSPKWFPLFHSQPVSNGIRYGLTLALTAVILSTTLFSYTTNGGLPSFADIWNMGFGAINPRSILDFTGSFQNSLMSMIFLANTPQLLMSSLYMMYNCLYTAMASADEWDRFYCQRKPLRVSAPKGQQRSTYFLSLPYRFSIPLIVASGGMHWLISQSIFLVRIAVVSDDIAVMHNQLTSCGWSTIAIIFLVIFWFLLLMTAYAIGMRRLGGSMPIGGTCSVAISAACHPPATDTNASLLPVRWGALNGIGEQEGGVGHCTFTSHEVVTPVEGRLYAGI